MRASYRRSRRRNGLEWYSRGVRKARLAGFLFVAGMGFGAWGQDPQPRAGAYLPDFGLQRFEVGAETANIRTACIGSTERCPIPSFGLGVGGALNLNAHFALDAEFLMTPTASTVTTNAYGGHAMEMMAGVRGEARGRHYGYFLKAEPGFFEWSEVITEADFVPTAPVPFLFSFGGRRFFVSDVGAGFEYSPSPRVRVRGEVTDLIFRYSREDWTNNLQPSVGVYYGMGKTLDWSPPVYAAQKTHAFFDRTNVVLLTGGALADTADAITTQRFIAAGDREDDPFARPLVKYGWSGQIAGMSLETGGEILGMYGLHRIHQRWVERLVPVGLAVTHGILAYNNTKLSHRQPPQ